MSNLNHDHLFENHIGILIAGRTATAWVPESQVSGDVTDYPQMQRCLRCGEQGYVVPA